MTQFQKKPYKEIWISDIEIGGVAEDPSMDWSEVHVIFEDDYEWIALFDTFKCLEYHYRRNEFCDSFEKKIGGNFFTHEKLIIIDFLTRERVAEIVDFLLENGEFFKYFRLIPNEEFELHFRTNAELPHYNNIKIYTDLYNQCISANGMFYDYFEIDGHSFSSLIWPSGKNKFTGDEREKIKLWLQGNKNIIDYK
ncbi:hypothetical protein ACFL0J_07895, partial [Candidatus Neomarinimicrobiota bacterium]